MFEATPGNIIDYQYHLPIEYMANAVKNLSDQTDKGVAQMDLFENKIATIKHPDTEHWNSKISEVKNKYKTSIEELTAINSRPIFASTPASLFRGVIYCYSRIVQHRITYCLISRRCVTR